MMKELPSSDQASLEGPALIPIVGNNIERGGWVNQYYQVKYFLFQLQIIYATSVNENAYIRNYR